MIHVDALLFDLDGTLIDSRKDLYLAVQHLQRRLGRPLSSEKAVASYVGDGVVKLVQRALPGIHGTKLEKAVASFKRYYHRHCLDHTRLYPGVRSVLRHFRHKKLAVVTNKPARVSRHILEGLKILSRLEMVLGGDSLEIKKPSPEPIHHALQTMNISSAKRAVVIGDGVNDIRAGRAAGTWTCGVLSNIGHPKNLRAEKPDILILKMHELMRFIS